MPKNKQFANHFIFVSKLIALNKQKPFSLLTKEISAFRIAEIAIQSQSNKGDSQ